MAREQTNIAPPGLKDLTMVRFRCEDEKNEGRFGWFGAKDVRDWFDVWPPGKHMEEVPDGGALNWGI